MGHFARGCYEAWALRLLCGETLSNQTRRMAMYTPIVIAAATTADLEPAAVTPDWVLNGMPQTRSKKLASSQDLTSHLMVWDCTASHFNWYYPKDDTLVLTSGETSILSDQ